MSNSIAASEPPATGIRIETERDPFFTARLVAEFGPDAVPLEFVHVGGADLVVHGLESRLRVAIE
jgi:hypothetical protein